MWVTTFAKAAAAEAIWSKPILWATLPLVGALLVAALAIALGKHWRRRRGPDQSTSSDQLAHFRVLYERGELSAEEFARIRSLLGDRLKKDLQPPAEKDRPDTAPDADTPVNLRENPPDQATGKVP